MIAGAIGSFNTPVVVTRSTTAVQFVDGIAQPVTTTDQFELGGISVQPMAAKERVLLPELIRDREVLKAYTQCELHSVDVAGKLLADRVTYRGQDYVVQSVQDWAPHGQYYKVTLVKEDD